MRGREHTVSIHGLAESICRWRTVHASERCTTVTTVTSRRAKDGVAIANFAVNNHAAVTAKKNVPCRMQFGRHKTSREKAFARFQPARGRRGSRAGGPRCSRGRAPGGTAPRRPAAVCNAARPPKILTRAPLPRVQSEEKGVPRLHRISTSYFI